MAALTKHTANAVSFQIKHNNREYDPGRKPRNIEIDPARTHLNYSLQPLDRVPISESTIVSQAEKTYYNMRMKELYHMRRKDLVTAAEWCITMPKDLDNFSPELQHKFFEESYLFCCKKYGEENIVQAVVHRDEGVKDKSGKLIAGQPHMHVLFIPVIPVTDTNPKHRQSHFKDKVNAKSLLNRHHLLRWHAEFQDWMNDRFEKDTGVHVSVCTGITAGKSKTVEQLKLETKNKELQKVIAEQNEKISAMEKQIDVNKDASNSPWGTDRHVWDMEY